MSRRIFIRSILTAVVAMLILVGCSGIDAGAVNQQSGEVYQSSQGLEVRPVEAKYQDLDASEVAKILDIQRWKFMVTPVDTQTKLNYQLELQTPNGEVKVLSSFSIIPVDTKPIETLLAIYPLEGSLFNSSKLKFFIESGGGSTTQILDNSFQEFSGYGPSSPAKLVRDSKFLLVRFSKNGGIGTNQDSLLYFRVQEVNSEQ